MLRTEQTRNCQVRNHPIVELRAFLTLKKNNGVAFEQTWLLFGFRWKKWQKPECQRETQKVKERMWTETRNSSHKPAEKQNCLCLAIHQLVVVFLLVIYISGAPGSPNPCSSLGVCKITKERGKGGEYQGDRGCNAGGKVEQIMYYAVVNRRRLQVASWPKGIQDVCWGWKTNVGRLCHPAESGFWTQVLKSKGVDVRAVDHIETSVGTTGSTRK